MRVIFAMLVVCSTSALAQRGGWGGYVGGGQGGTWTGYVGGFQRDAAQSPSWYVGSRYVGPTVQTPRYSRGTTQALIVANSVNALTASTFMAQQQLNAQREALAEQQQALEQQQLAAQQEFAARQEALAEQQLAAQRQALAAQQAQLAAAQQEAERARYETERTLAATEQAQQQTEAAREAARRQRELDERKAAPQTPGNPVFHWVDADGVEHYSTRPRDAK